MPRKKNSPNYNISLLIQVIDEKLPKGGKAWDEVAALYHVRSGEEELRDSDNLKR